MSARKKITNSTALVPVEKRAIAALGLQHREKELATLAAATTHIVAITNDDGYKQVDSARKALKRTRLEIQKIGDETIDQAKRVVKLADVELTRLVGIIETEEDRLKTLQDARDTEIEAQRQAEIDREVARQSALQARLTELRGNQSLSPTSGAALIAEHISDLEAIAVDESFEELHEQAVAAKADGLARLRDLHLAAISCETEQKNIADERAELARLRREAADRAAADATAATERQRVLNEENGSKRAELKVERNRQTESHAEIAGVTDEVLAAREPAAPARCRSAEGGQIWTPGASVEAAPPTRDELIAVIANHYLVEPWKALEWISQVDWRAALSDAA